MDGHGETPQFFLPWQRCGIIQLKRCHCKVDVSGSSHLLEDVTILCQNRLEKSQFLLPPMVPRPEQNSRFAVARYVGQKTLDESSSFNRGHEL